MNTPDSKKEALYFIAIIPPSPLCEELMALKEEFRDVYQSKASLNSLPHITLHMPFKYKVKKEVKLLNTLEIFTSQQYGFEIKLNGFGAFEPRVIYTKIEDNEALILLQKALADLCRRELKLLNANYRNHAFHPHITLAFRDLKKTQFKQAWSLYEPKSLEASFKASAICLLKHNGKSWNPIQTIGFATEV